jgi:hypothetical protein
MEIELRAFPENYYGQIDGIMLEQFPAMSEVLRRLANLPPEEQRAWGKMLALWGMQLVARNEEVLEQRDAS